ncbi:citrate transporter [Eggerthella sp. HF-4214]|uniref:Citrate transporter n=1 Tax=Eggerthella guodeyinii TaxID=2690837 RepID=A0A6N7RME3_9ACTN|nr:citrate transporter [Eggerthella guodeyinii]
MTHDRTRSRTINAPQARGVLARRDAVSACARFARTHAVLLVSAAVAAATMLAVPPDAAYLGYFDLKTLACLFGILALVGALRNAGVFEATARALVARFSTCRAAIAAIVGITLVLSMIATNDMALIMMLPLSAATLLKAGWERALPFAFIMQSLAANLGGMIVPFGNPQNLYLFERFSIPLVDFLAVMALPFAVSVLLIGVCCAVFAKPAPRVPEARLAQGRPQEPPAPVDRRRALACGALLALVIASVFRLVPYPVALVAVVAGLLVLDRRALRSVDFGLLLTFACFFVFAGNMARMPAVEEVLSQAMAHNALLASAGASQIISNVPAAVLLSHFTDSYEALLVGVNIGGAGTLVASLASLITFNQYRAVKAAFGRRPELARQTAGGFVVRFTVFNASFLAVLYLVCALWS